MVGRRGAGGTASFHLIVAGLFFLARSCRAQKGNWSQFADRFFLVEICCNFLGEDPPADGLPPRLDGSMVPAVCWVSHRERRARDLLNTLHGPISRSLTLTSQICTCSAPVDPDPE